MKTNLYFIKHSSFILETQNFVLLFDYFEGDLPFLPQNKPLIVFSSHFHADHFNRKILEINHPNITYILDKDIKRKIKHAENIDEILFVKPNENYTLAGMKINTLKSTDEGVAFIIECDGLKIYHAGDLNHWHWEGEDESENLKMAQLYLSEMEKISDFKFDFAFIPIDPRLENSYDLGLKGFLKHATAKTIIPMHTWGDFSVIKKLKSKFSQENILDITKENQTLETGE